MHLHATLPPGLSSHCQWRHRPAPPPRRPPLVAGRARGPRRRRRRRVL